MTQRISDEQLNVLASDWEAEPFLAALASYEVTTAITLDLRDSRSEVSRLQGEVERLQGLIENNKDGGK